MVAARASPASGAAEAIATAARESAASGATAEMDMTDRDGSQIATVRTVALGTAAARAMAVGGSERGQSLAARAAT